MDVAVNVDPFIPAPTGLSLILKVHGSKRCSYAATCRKVSTHGAYEAVAHLLSAHRAPAKSKYPPAHTTQRSMGVGLKEEAIGSDERAAEQGCAPTKTNTPK
jgi:hypothetical protein